jgi:hypothetical protein
MGNKNTKNIDAFRSKTTNNGRVNDNDDIAPGEGGRWLHPDIKKKIREEHEKEMEQRRKKDRDLLYRKTRKNKK